MSFNADRPHRLAEKDYLRYGPFVASVVNAVRRQPLSDGIVIALDGPWGSGKTSVVNRVAEQLTADNVDQTGISTTVAYFDPWLVTGQQNLVSHFFGQLSDILRKEVSRTASNLLGQIKDIVTQNAPVVFDALAGVAELAGANIAAKASTYLSKATSGAVKAPTLVDLREKLSDLLRQQCRRIVVIIDDIDRLESDEMRQLLGMLKSVADLPSIVYVLPLDLDVVRSALIRPGAPSARSFVDKIIQVKLALPVPTARSMESLFRDRLIEASAGADMDSEDFRDIGTNIVEAFLDTPRAIISLANSTFLAWSTIGHEAYFPNVMGMEAIRLFAPSIYTALWKARKFIGDENTDNRRPVLEKFFMENGIVAGDSLARLLAQLLLGTSRSRREPGKAAIRGRKMADPGGLQLYFEWSVKNGNATLSQIDQFATALCTPNAATAYLRSIDMQNADDSVDVVHDLLNSIADNWPRDPAAPIDGIVDLLNGRKAIGLEESSQRLKRTEHVVDDAACALLSLSNIDKRAASLEKILRRDDLTVLGGCALLEAITNNPSVTQWRGDPSAGMLQAKWIKEIVIRRTAQEMWDAGEDVVWLLQKNQAWSDIMLLIRAFASDDAVAMKLAYASLPDLRSPEGESPSNLESVARKLVELCGSITMPEEDIDWISIINDYTDLRSSLRE